MARRVLIAEDEELLRDMLIDHFEDHGFEVVAFASADEACAFIHEHGCLFNLLFTDVKMPGAKTGLDLAFNARQLKPDLPIVISSGYFDGPMQKLSEVVLLPKPWDLQKLEDACGLASI